MKTKFEIGQKVQVIKHGEILISGTVKQTDTNLCTGIQEYCIDYLREGKTWTMICVPEDNVQAIL